MRDRLINAPRNVTLVRGLDERTELIKKKTEGDMRGLHLLFLNCYVCLKWKTITDSKVFIKRDSLSGGG